MYIGLDISNEGLPENHRGFHWWPSLTTNCIISFRIRWKPPKPSLQIKIADEIFTEFYTRIKKQKKMVLKRLQMSKMMYSQLKIKKLRPFASEIVYLTNSSVARVNPESMTKNTNSRWSNLIILGLCYFTEILNTSFPNKMCLSDMILLKCNTFSTYWLCLALWTLNIHRGKKKRNRNKCISYRWKISIGFISSLYLSLMHSQQSFELVYC